MIYKISIIIFIYIIFYLLNKHLNKYENFLNIYQYLNDNFKKNIKENKKDFNINKNFHNFHDLFLKNIYMTYSVRKNKYIFYLFNYEKKLYMKCDIKKDKNNFDITDVNNKTLGKLINHHHNIYKIDLNNLYKKEFIYVIQNNYQQIKIYNQFDYDIYYLKKYEDNNNKKFKMFLFDQEIGYINKDEKSFKFFIKDKYLKEVNLFSYALIIFIINNQI